MAEQMNYDAFWEAKMEDKLLGQARMKECQYHKAKSAGDESWDYCEMNEVFVTEDDCSNCEVE